MRIRRVGGEQARAAKEYGLVKIDYASAKRLVESGVPVLIVGNRVAPWHFFGGWRLAHTIDPKRLAEEDVSFDSYVRNFEFYLDPELGDRAAFFVGKKDYRILAERNEYGPVDAMRRS